MALSATLNDPVLSPLALGVNTTLMVHLDLAARLLPQVVAETLKSPVVEITMLLSATFCLLERVKLTGALDVPTARDAKVKLAGVSVACAVPLPESGTDCGLPAALSVIVILPVRDPSWVGVNVTLITQLFPAASVLPQDFAAIT
jgi:hypothetical protein